VAFKTNGQQEKGTLHTQIALGEAVGILLRRNETAEEIPVPVRYDSQSVLLSFPTEVKVARIEAIATAPQKGISVPVEPCEGFWEVRSNH
jgi:hypothetical protein